MAKITFVEHDGTEHVLDVRTGVSLMAAATEHGVPGIDGDCGGNCACATCHLFVDARWHARIGGPDSEMERDLLDFADGANEMSRLGCQIAVSEDMDGLTVQLPLGQH
ncbi:MAG: 2Fe-2S ferredoxin [Pseudomonadota bacterium]